MDEEYSRGNTNFLEQEPEFRQKPPRKKGRLFLFMLICFLLFAGFLVTRAIQTEIPDDPMAYDPVTLEPKKPEGLLKRLKHFIFQKEVDLEGQKEDRINILLLGMGGPGHDGPYLTDTIIIASVKPSNGQIAMISIPRDLGVDIPKYGWRKINSANALGEVNKPNWGAAYTTELIENTFDIDIHYYARVDFKAFEEIIDEVGGITVHVDRSFVDREYPAAADKYQVVSFTKGEQKMEGDDALKYARSRHGNNGEGSDFARARRQQKVLLALKEKVFSIGTLANPVRIHNIMKSLDTHVTTNMEFSDIIALIKLGRELDTSNINTVVLDNSEDGYLKNGYSPDGAFILEPKSGNFDEIKQLISGVFEITEVEENDTPVQETEDKRLEDAAVEIQNGTWQAGLAARVKSILQKKEFIITDIGNTEERPQMQSGIYNVSGKNLGDVVDALKNELGIPAKEKTKAFTWATSTDILIILGEDYKE